MRDGVFVSGGEFVLRGFGVVDAGDDAVCCVGEVPGEGVVGGGVVDELVWREICMLVWMNVFMKL